MIFNIDIFKKVTEKIRSRFSFFTDPNKSTLEITPYRDWLLLIIIITIVVIALSVIAVYLFIMINSDETVETDIIEGNKSLSVDKETLNEVLDAFSEKESAYEKLFNTSPYIIDPSL